ncbi:hypothetical protein HMPREF0731_4487, partial [Pseudoroseomonas cervicalis ATCC 49957]
PRQPPARPAPDATLHPPHWQRPGPDTTPGCPDAASHALQLHHGS